MSSIRSTLNILSASPSSSFPSNEDTGSAVSGGSVFSYRNRPHWPCFSLSNTPLTDWSYYVRDTNRNHWYTLGCDQGHFDRDNGWKNSFVILDFGGQTSTGAKLTATQIYVTFANIRDWSQEFAHGYWYCTGADTSSVLTLAIGTNNDYDLSYSYGQTWANMIRDIRTYISTSPHNYASQVVVQAANDIEPGFSVSKSATEAWVNGLASGGGVNFYNFGSADGCSVSATASGSGLACSNGWYQYDLWLVSWGASPAYSVPEIYIDYYSGTNTYATNAKQWAWISQYGYSYQNSQKIWFTGPLD
jgi:hypothetical protein